jgi:hypothetical protein
MKVLGMKYGEQDREGPRNIYYSGVYNKVTVDQLSITEKPFQASPISLS